MRYVTGKHRKDHGQTQEMQKSLFNIAYEKTKYGEEHNFPYKKATYSLLSSAVLMYVTHI